MSIVPREDAGATNCAQKQGQGLPGVTPPPHPKGHYGWWATLQPDGLHQAWFPHEQPHREPDSYMLVCHGPCLACHRTVIGTTRSEGRMPVEQRLIDRTRRPRRTGARR